MECGNKPLFSSAHKAYSFCVGAACHILFLVGVGLMGWMLYDGLLHPLLPIGGLFGRTMDIVFLMQFPILHSFLLSSIGTKILARLHPQAVGRPLVSTSFALVASLQLVVTFLFWTPIGEIAYRAAGSIDLFLCGLFVASWLLLVKSLSDAGLGLQTGFLGWSSVVQGKEPRYKSFPTSGLFHVCRQPIYLSFFLILLTAPTWSVDRGLFILCWGT